MGSSDEESGPNSGGTGTDKEEMEYEESSEASQQASGSEENETENVNSKKKSREWELLVPTAKKRVKAKTDRGGLSAEEEELTAESSGDEVNDKVQSKKKSEELKSTKGTAMTKAKAKKRRGRTAEEDEMTGGSGQDGGSDLKESDNEKSNKELHGQEARKQTTVKKVKAKKNKGKTGVVYLSRIPPHMKPLKLRHLLSQYGEVSRVYLAPEDNAARIRRKRAGGNSGKNFTEGWVEFIHKRDAKRVAAMLNGEPVDPRKRSAYHYDLWTIKYLKRFKWDNLTAEIAYKKAVREQKIAAEVSAAKKERDFYLAKVDQARAISSMEERKQKRKEPEGNESSAAGDGENRDGGGAKKPRFVRSFHQRKSVVDPAMETKARLAADVLARVFGRSPVK